MAEKTCSGCKLPKNIEEFSPRPERGPNVRRSKCKECTALVSVKWRERNPGYSKALAIRDPLYAKKATYKHVYGLEWDQYERMLLEQNGHCAMCPSNRRLCVDHNHTTGKVRGILCNKCNAKLASVEDEDYRTRALRYLARFT